MVWLLRRPVGGHRPAALPLTASRVLGTFRLLVHRFVRRRAHQILLQSLELVRVDLDFSDSLLLLLGRHGPICVQATSDRLNRVHLAVANGLTARLYKVLDVVEATAPVAVALYGIGPDFIGLPVDFGDHLILLIRPQLSFLVDIVGLHELLRHENKRIGVDLDFLL